MDAIERANREDEEVWTSRPPPPHPHRAMMYRGGYAGLGGKMIDNDNPLFDEVSIVDESLKSNGLSRRDLTPKAYACLLEQARRYALELLVNAQDYAIHAHRHQAGGGGRGGSRCGGRTTSHDIDDDNHRLRRALPTILPPDLHLANESLEESGGGGGATGVSCTLPNVERISELARLVNGVPLPPVPPGCYDGITLPPEKERLMSRTYDVVEGARNVQRMIRGGEMPEGVVAPSAASAADGGGGPMMRPSSSGGGVGGQRGARMTTTAASYGASRGRQIAVRIRGGDRGAGTGAPPSGTTTDAADPSSSMIGGGGGGNGATTMTTADDSGGGVSASSTTTTKPWTKKGNKRTLTEL
ncbi:hypothetical protein ACHAW5_003035 [Stephanodiscus triporus]|uniref:Transcription initiation factor TFIID subunit 8 n=1 Tax=Stephanodiscus triporus TaxID=2934178 RepID=A0ABD3NQQ9_9STRA